MNSDPSPHNTFIKLLLSKYKALFQLEQQRPKNDDNNDEGQDWNEHEHERKQKRIELRRKVQRGTLLSLLAFIIFWWKKKLKRSHFQQHLLSRAFRTSWSKKKGQEDHRNAIEAPLSVLLTAAKKGIVSKAMINSIMIAYKLETPLDGPSSLTSRPLSTKWKKTILPKGNPSVIKDLMNDITDGGCLDISVLPEPLLSRLAPIFMTAFPFMYLFVLYHMMKRLQKGNSNSDDTGTDYLKDGPEKTTFADVAGIDTAQVELQEIVSYLSDPKPFLQVGAAPPRGLLLHGKPGLGKTLLARAVAGEANADHFISCSGSDFVEIYVGQGAKRVRDLFSDARKQAMKKWRKEHCDSKLGQFVEMFPFLKKSTSMRENGYDGKRPPTAVLFIDEIDALAKCRDGIGRGLLNGGSGGNDEREQTLNALLAEMDGFNRSDVLLIVIAATNRLSMLDPALMRPGRFDRHVALSPPNAAGRESILKVHARNKVFHENVDLAKLSDDKWTANFTGAELRNVINEAALLAVREGSTAICQNHLHLSIERVKVMKRYASY